MRLFCFLLVLITINVSNAQLVRISEEFALKSNYEYDLLGKFGESYLLIRNGDFEFDIQSFDLDLRQSWTKDIPLDTKRDRIIEIIAHPQDNQFHVIYSTPNRDTIFVKNKTFNEKIEEVHDDTILITKRGLFRPAFRFVRSEDDHIILLSVVENQVVQSTLAYNLETYREIYFLELALIDYNFREEYRSTIVTNDGEMFMIFEKNNFKFKQDQHEMHVFRYSLEQDQLDKLRIELYDWITYDALFKYDNINHQLLLTGMFSIDNFGSADGIFHISVAGKGDIKPTVFRTLNFEEDVISDFHGRYDAKRRKLTNLDAQDIVLRQDGGIILVAEENKQFERVGYNARRDYGINGTSRYSVDYYYEDVLLISIHANGDPHWQKLLPKRQYSNDDRAVYSSYFLFKNPSSIRILYNDEIRNENTVSEYVLNGAGDITRRSLMSTDNQRLKLQIKNAIQTDNNQLIVPSVVGKKLKLVTITY